ncbi:hypothetical protein PPL_07437 [Heterostelium album PN500]|uniref:Uncharacterized protein n=1 Tax=Heterostelium pallidum (strain ATCC 26659 / Pp 5 / PN500) TaxID=670386 RepID=D3BFY6_HETP5|nr:hypothetical protein PPL_07437 [Heterostelium album PN500]EFA79746.1 hypothetical protein PPL_07437 [Heterostelium album PN500]|eukprot:XP_020431867.1 hypothetical protein PPL_07437 [Heterostelium album PN500]
MLRSFMNLFFMKQLKPLVDVINKWVKEKKIVVGGHTYKVDIVFVNDYKCFTELQGLEVFNPKVFFKCMWCFCNLDDIELLLRDYSSNVEVGDVKFKLEPPGSKIGGHDEHMMPVFSPKALKDLGGEVNGKLYGQVQPPVFEYSFNMQSKHGYYRNYCKHIMKVLREIDVDEPTIRRLFDDNYKTRLSLSNQDKATLHEKFIAKSQTMFGNVQTPTLEPAPAKRGRPRKTTTSTPPPSLSVTLALTATPGTKLFFKCFRPDLTPAVLPNSTSSNTTQPMVAKQKRVRTSTHGLPANLQTNLPNVTYNDDCTDTIPHEKQCSSNQVLEIYTSDSNNSTSSFSKNSTNKRKR